MPRAKRTQVTAVINATNRVNKQSTFGRLYRHLKRLIPARLRQAVRVSAYLIKNNPRELRSIFQSVRSGSWTDVLGCYEDFNSRRDKYLDLAVRGITTPVRLRTGTSDFDVFRQVFLSR